MNPPAGAHGLINEEPSQAHLPTSLDIFEAELAELVCAKDVRVTCQRQCEMMRRLSFWLESCAHSFSLSLPPHPPWWQDADNFLARHYDRHTRLADLPAASECRSVLVEPTDQQRAVGAGTFVEEFVPRREWPAPRQVSVEQHLGAYAAVRARHFAQPEDSELPGRTPEPGVPPQ